MSIHWRSYTAILVKYLKPQQAKVYGLIGLLLASTLLQLLGPRIIGAFIDNVTTGAAMPTLVRLASFFLGIALLGYLVKLGETYVSEDVGWTATNQLRADLTSHCLHLDMAFHNAIYAASGNSLIEQSAQLHWRHLRRVMGAVLQQSRQREAVWDEHEAIADAIAAGDADRAALFIEQHSQRAGDNLAAQLTQVLQSTEGDKR